MIENSKEFRNELSITIIILFLPTFSITSVPRSLSKLGISFRAEVAFFHIRLRGGSNEQSDSWEMQKPRAPRKKSGGRKTKAASQQARMEDGAPTFLGWVQRDNYHDDSLAHIATFQ